MTDADLPTSEDVLAVHEEIEEEFNMKYTGTRGAAPELKLKRIIEHADERGDRYARAASLLRNIITAHVFEDGNKRTAWAVTNAYLERKGATPAATGMSAERVLKRIRRFEVDEIADWLETGEIDEERLHP